MKFFILLLLLISFFLKALPQAGQTNDIAESYKAGYRNIVAIDSERIYKPNSLAGSKFHFRPIEIDFWYPAKVPGNNPAIQYCYYMAPADQSG